jgi:hypothetical protein
MVKSKHEKRHPSCPEHGPGLLIERYDAYACIECDKWLESDCDDPACAFCAMRPPRPSAVDTEPAPP